LREWKDSSTLSSLPVPLSFMQDGCHARLPSSRSEENAFPPLFSPPPSFRRDLPFLCLNPSWRPRRCVLPRRPFSFFLLEKRDSFFFGGSTQFFFTMPSAALPHQMSPLFFSPPPPPPPPSGPDDGVYRAAAPFLPLHGAEITPFLFFFSFELSTFFTFSLEKKYHWPSFFSLIRRSGRRYFSFFQSFLKDPLLMKKEEPSPPPSEAPSTLGVLPFG